MGNALIIGCGYLGQRVASRWQALGWSVAATTRSPARAAEFHGRGWLPVICDVLSPESMPSIPAADVVLYSIGMDRSSGASAAEFYVPGIANILQVVGRPRCFIYISSTSVYGQTGGEEVDETAETSPLEETGRQILAAEMILRQRLPEAVILRFGGIYGPGRLIRSRDILTGQSLAGDPDKWLNLIHVEDGATAVVLAAERGKLGEIFNVSDGCPVQRGDFYRHLAEQLGAPAPRFDQHIDHRNDRANRRVVNRKLVAKLGMTFRFPSFREGLAGL